MTEKKSPPREISMRGTIHAAIKAKAPEKGLGPLIDRLITDYLDRVLREISICGDTHTAIEVKAEEIGITVGRLVDRIVTYYLDREGAPE